MNKFEFLLVLSKDPVFCKKFAQVLTITLAFEMRR